ncbi:alginate lyase family protein [Neotamlana laminarinivorans]|uniref:Heparinase II/III family protein n=1 Tax=Neotamlana laminarinivorans TaxID=2883124 RepID=A0A9X1I0C6_9FLAO|nr:alginate lyase family protein [Tamlana laminarinivorans]MCB4799474.1 heparinase II/III family protein [Tamlana laminarinivorans]
MNLLKVLKRVSMLMALLIMLACNETKSLKKVSVDGETKVSHPSLIITAQGVEDIRNNLGSIPIFDKTLEETKAIVDAEIEKGIDVPVPKDYSGGYTHEQHKKNYVNMQKAGVLYQILNDEKYAKYVKDMLFAYKNLYPTLPVHPQPRSYARGKLFWQCLNDSNWLVYTSQAYDCIYNYLSKEERDDLEITLFKPFADFISIENPQFFNRVHNHSTWGSVAVGMIALVMEDDSLLNRALYGIKGLDMDPSMKDNDGGFINKDGKAGFYANLEEPFSPDGYYTEGPYYQRYASYPFLIFAQALQNKKPDLGVFKFKDSVLLKSVNALLNLSDADGDFFLLNDSQKGMSYYNSALVSAVDIAYQFGGKNPELLSIAKKQDQVTLDDAGLSVALGIKNDLEKPFVKRSVQLTDGPNGDQGAVGILRKNPIEVVFKYTAHGLSHGHFDKLSFALFDNGDEVVQDYGLARYVNIEQKGGGNYLKENKTWAKQTIAHNTLVQNQTSHFQGKYSIGSKYHSNQYIFNVSNNNVQVASAKESNAYPGTNMHRTMVLIQDENYTNPIVLDILRVNSSTQNQYDLPFYYLGQLMQTNFEYNKLEVPSVLGKSDGYQHLYKEATAKSSGDNMQLNWLHNNKFYTYTAVTNAADEIILARIGANDPEYNLRNEPSLIIRKKGVKDALFVSSIESHGTYNPVTELAIDAYSNIDKIEVAYNSVDYTAVRIIMKSKEEKLFVICNNDNQENKTHSITLNGTTYSWKGVFTLI